MTLTDPGGDGPPSLWDRVVRTSHWGIAVVVLTNEALTRGGSVAHVWAGWIGLALLALRLVWGLIGSTEARFAAFPPNPGAAIDHFKDLAAGHPRPHRSHNPAGAVMVYALWGTLALLIASGLAMSGINPLATAREAAILTSADWSDTAPIAEGDEDEDEDEDDEIIEEIHEALANLLLVLVGLHIAGVFLEGAVTRRNLVPPMLFGDRTRPQTNKDQSGS